MEAEAYEHSRYACAVGEEIHNSGFLDALGVTSWGRGLKHVTEHLEPGVYEVTYWYQRHPAGPWGSEEWDAGLNVERVIPGGGESNG